MTTLALAHTLLSLQVTSLTSLDNSQVVDLQVFATPRITLKPLVPSFPCFANIYVSLLQKVCGVTISIVMQKDILLGSKESSIIIHSFWFRSHMLTLDWNCLELMLCLFLACTNLSRYSSFYFCFFFDGWMDWSEVVSCLFQQTISATVDYKLSSPFMIMLFVCLFGGWSACIEDKYLPYKSIAAQGLQIQGSWNYLYGP